MIDLEEIEECCNIYEGQIYAELSAPVLRRLISETRKLRSNLADAESYLSFEQGENERLRAKLAEIEKQEPIYMWRLEDDGWMECTKDWFESDMANEYEKRIVYAHPVAISKTETTTRRIGDIHIGGEVLPEFRWDKFCKGCGVDANNLHLDSCPTLKSKL